MAAIGAHASQDRVVARPLVVLVACRIRLYRDAIVRLLGKQSGISAFWASTIEDGLLTDYDATLPDVVLLDGGMSGGLAMARHLVQARSKARILAFGVDNVAVDVIACAEAGLMGYVRMPGLDPRIGGCSPAGDGWRIGVSRRHRGQAVQPFSQRIRGYTGGEGQGRADWPADGDPPADPPRHVQQADCRAPVARHVNREESRARSAGASPGWPTR